MKLSYGYILEHLSKHYTVLAATDAVTASYTMPTRYTQDKALESGRIYLVDYPCTIDCPEDRDVLVVYRCLASNQPSSENMLVQINTAPSVCSIALLTEDTELAALFECLVELFYRNQTWVETLEQLLFSDTTSTVQDYLDTSVRLRGGELFYLPLDTWRDCICSTAPQYTASVAADTIDESGRAFAELANYDELQEIVNSFEPIVLIKQGRSGAELKLTTAAVREKGGLCLGLLVMPVNGTEVTQAELWFVLQLRDALEAQLAAYTSLNERESFTSHGLLKRLLSEESSDSRVMKRHLKSYGLISDNDYACALFRVYSEGAQKMPPRQFCSLIESLGEGCYAVEYESDIVVLIKISSLKQTMNDFITTVFGYLAPIKARAGISFNFCDLLLLRDYAKQARAALRIGSETDKSLSIHYFSDIACSYLVRHGTSELPARLLCMPGVLALQKLSDSGGVDYVETLRIHLRNACNASLTARALYIHRSTLLYRLERIAQITQTDLNNPDDRLYLELSLLLLNRF